MRPFKLIINSTNQCNYLCISFWDKLDSPPNINEFPHEKSGGVFSGGHPKDYLSCLTQFGAMDFNWGWLGKASKQKERDSSDDDKNPKHRHRSWSEVVRDSPIGSGKAAVSAPPPELEWGGQGLADRLWKGDNECDNSLFKCDCPHADFSPKANGQTYHLRPSGHIHWWTGGCFSCWGPKNALAKENQSKQWRLDRTQIKEDSQERT